MFVDNQPAVSHSCCGQLQVNNINPSVSRCAVEFGWQHWDFRTTERIHCWWYGRLVISGAEQLNLEDLITTAITALFTEVFEISLRYLRHTWTSMLANRVPIFV